MSGASEFVCGSLACRVCRADVLGEALGNCVWAENLDPAATPRYVDIYWVCKGVCDKFVQAVLRDEGFGAPWADVEDLKNPLEHRRWTKVTSRQIERGEISETAAAKISEVLRITAPLADREPTQEDMVRFRQLRWFDGM